MKNNNFNLIGHRKVIDYFKVLKKHNRLAHAYMFTGKKGIGKRKAAKYIAMMLNCRKDNPPCLNCPDCRQIISGAHPDLIDISFDKSIKIDEIRMIEKRVFLKNRGLAYKVVIIDNADMLTPEAGNAFLKTLEEPPKDTLFFLITSKPENILGTIKSRAQKLWFSLSFPEARECLDNLSGRGIDRELVLKISESDLSRASDLVFGKLPAMRKSVIESLSVFAKQRDKLKESVFILLTFLRDCLLLKTNNEPLVINSDFREEIYRYQKKFALESIEDKITSLMVLYPALDNININLANNFLANILE